MKAKVIKKQNKQLLDALKPILEAESIHIEEVLNLCANCIDDLRVHILPNATDELTDTFYAFMTHGLSVVLIKNQQKKGELKKW